MREQDGTVARLRLMSWIGLFLLAVVSGNIIADEPAPAKTSDAAPPATGDVPLEPFVPAQPITDEEKAQLEAKKLFVIGLSQIDRRQLVTARRTMERALELDPKNIAVLRELVPLVLQLNDAVAGMDYCRRAIEIDPDDYRLLHLLASLYAQIGKLPEAVDLLTQASKVEGLAKDDPRMFLQIRGDLAQHLQTLGRTEESIEPLKDMIDIAENPTKYDVGDFAKRQLERRKFMDYEQLGRALSKMGRYEEAVQTLDKARNSDDRGKRLSLVIAEISIDHGDFERAARELETYIALGSQNHIAFEKYAEVLTKLGRKKDLMGQLERWLDVDGDNPILREFYAKQLIEIGDYDSAKLELDRLRGRAAATDLRALLYRKMGEPTKLLDLLVESIRPADRSLIDDQIDAIAKDPELVKAMAQAAREIKPDDPKSFFASYLMFMIAMKAEEQDISVEFVKRCLDDEKIPPDARLYDQLIRLLAENRRFEDVVTATEKAEKAVPSQKVYFLERRALALESLGRGEEAVKLLDEFAKDNKNSDDVIQAKLAAARIYLQQEEFDEAAQVCRDVLNDFPQYDQTVYVKYLLATTLGQKGDLGEFEKLMLELLSDPRVLPDFAATLNNDLGYTWAEHDKNLDQAELMVRKALETKPDEAAYLDSLGWVLFKRGDYEQAVRHLQEAVEKTAGQDPVIFEHLGDAYLKVENRSEAQKAWEKAIRLLADTKTTKAKEQREQLEKKMKLLVGETSDASR